MDGPRASKPGDAGSSGPAPHGLPRSPRSEPAESTSRPGSRPHDRPPPPGEDVPTGPDGKWRFIERLIERLERRWPAIAARVRATAPSLLALLAVATLAVAAGFVAGIHFALQFLETLRDRLG